MKIGIISDIHANQYALTEVLELFEKKKVKKIFILGDIVGYYYGTKEVLKIIKEWDCDVIKGNHEEILSKLYSKKLSENEVTTKYGSGHINSIKSLSDSELFYLFNLPHKIYRQYNDKKLFFCHANPWLGNEYIYPDSPKVLLNRFSEYKFDFIFFGHSHYPFSFSINNTICINPGSVGQPRDIFSLSSCGILDIENFVYTNYKVPYNKKILIEEIRNNDPDNNYLQLVLNR